MKHCVMQNYEEQVRECPIRGDRLPQIVGFRAIHEKRVMALDYDHLRNVQPNLCAPRQTTCGYDMVTAIMSNKAVAPSSLPSPQAHGCFRSPSDPPVPRISSDHVRIRHGDGHHVQQGLCQAQHSVHKGEKTARGVGAARPTHSILWGAHNTWGGGARSTKINPIL
jgi:hypothetical protein